MDKKKIIFFGVALLTLAVILMLPLPPEIKMGTKTIALTSAGKASLAVMAMVVILWISEAVPFAIAGLFGMSVMVMTKASTLKPLVQDGFGNSIILFFIGVLIFSAAISHTSLLERLTGKLLYKLGHSPKSILFVFLVIGVVLSGWITDMAVAAMLAPIAVTILKKAKVQPLKSNFGKALLIACAWGPHIGGIATPAGCGPNPLTMTFLHDLAGIDFTFIDWMILGYPAAILMTPISWILLIWAFPFEKIDLKVTEADYKKQIKKFGKITYKEIATVAICFLTMILWIFGAWIADWSGGAIDYLGIKFVAITCACLFFLPGIAIVPWKKAESDINWGGIILIVTGLAMGTVVYKTGAAEWIAMLAFNKLALLHPVMIIFTIVIGVSVMKVMFSSNTVAGIIMVPLLIALAKNIGVDPVLVALAAGITVSLAFILVTTTPTNVIPYSTGYFSIRDMMKVGIWMTIAAAVCVTISIAVMGALFGIVKL